jgi:hypothetical protein
MNKQEHITAVKGLVDDYGKGNLKSVLIIKYIATIAKAVLFLLYSSKEDGSK